MEEKIAFGPWEIPKSGYLSVCGNYDRAGQIDDSDIRFDLDAKTADVASESSDSFYSASLDGCTCESYRFGRLPCKHMIRLAMELGETFDVPEFDPYAAADYDVNEDIARLTERWRSGQLTLQALTQCVKALKASAKKAKRPRGRSRKSADDNV